MGKDVNKRKSIRHAKIVTEICISAVILAFAGYAVKTVSDRMHPLGPSTYVESSGADAETEEPTTEPVDPNKIIFETATVSTKDKFKGDLILVNSEHQYFGGNEELVSVNEKLNEEGRTSYIGNDNDMQILGRIYTPLSDMLDAFNSATGYDDIVIIGGYRTTDQQQALYDEDLESTGLDTSDRVALPGHSEHESGYAVDFTTSTTWDYDGTGEYDWINKNCWKYGFILRYPEDKTEITKIKYEPWHYRYVGVPHAYYMYVNGICLEEYAELLKNYPYEGEHLKFSDENGTEYEIYFVPSDDSADNTIIPVPSSLKYDISGNNDDGFIVTVYSGQKSESTAQPDESGSQAEPQDSGDTSSGDESIGDSADGQQQA